MSNLRGSAYLLAALGAVIWCVSLFWTPTPPPKYQGLGSVRALIPQELSGFRQVQENQISDSVRQALAAADIISFTYQREGGTSIDLTLIGGTDRSALHDPRSCLIGAGWRIENDHTEDLPGTGLQARVCRVTGSGNNDFEVLYLYVVGERVITQVTQIRTQMLLSALVGRKGTPVCFVRFMRPLPRGGSDNPEAARQFRQFAGSAWTLLKIKEAIQAG